MTCPICDVKEKGELNIVYEDEHIFVVLPEQPAIKGHLKMYSTKHYQNVSEVENGAFFFTAASLCATALFELLGAQGTNIIINNGGFEGGNIHLAVDIIARNEDDGLDFKWEPKQFDDTEMKNIEERIRDKTFFIGKEKQEDIPKVIEGAAPEPVSKSEEGGNYLIKQLRRIP